ncbi:MAG: arsenate reductase ArsC [Geminicoccaceae bacterium]|nr:arsenate reductase ArsC [Geminicoccaceae bacterium]MCS7268947.1 arsenate reductase ArsC [Geminicoccaceae bacterium]MCX7631568.1 arsenate reductase ArsC [Geminicoccaceae bacterium]MDW8124845.1 arsenate reductase ArsC [Geminicoccaceae bacterium]MDW8340797.1 arsenate reductase ArsC [Geminicoccaceae bacterium]
MAECALNRWGSGRFRAFSAGSRPRGEVHPMTIEILRRLNYDTTALRSKSWEEFARPGAPPLDFVFTVCDQAAKEPCPVWPGQPMTAHWGVEDPVLFEGSEEQKLRYWLKIYTYLENRIKIFVNLPIEALDRLALQRRLDEIGKTTPPDTAPDL